MKPGTIILICGLPAAGKSTFCRYLAREHGFAAYELECHPRGWPHPELKHLWDSDPTAFVGELMRLHSRIVLEWGFPPRCRTVVDELQGAGVQSVWFGADEAAARRTFLARGGIEPTLFEDQVRAIRDAGLPVGFSAIVIQTLLADGTFKSGPETLDAIKNALGGL